MLIEVGSYATGDQKARELYKKVQADVADMGGPAKFAPGKSEASCSRVGVAVSSAGKPSSQKTTIKLTAPADLVARCEATGFCA